MSSPDSGLLRENPIQKIEYRSPGLEPGALNRIGVPHVHIDGARDQHLILDIVQELETKGDLGKFNHVLHSVAGRQRLELPGVYESHTPFIDNQEALDFFSSNIVKDRVDAIEAVNFISHRIKGIPGCIVELEQVVGWRDPKGWSWIEPKDEIEPIQSGEVNFTPQETLSYEVHHGFNLAKTSETPPVELESLLKYCENNGVVLGGWFVFDKGTEWAYRSNSFTNSADIRNIIEKEQGVINNFLEKQQLNGQTRTLVERVLGIWRSEGAQDQ